MLTEGRMAGEKTAYTAWIKCGLFAADVDPPTLNLIEPVGRDTACRLRRARTIADVLPLIGPVITSHHDRVEGPGTGASRPETPRTESSLMPCGVRCAASC